MASAEQLRSTIDMHDLALRLGLKRDGKLGGKSCNYSAPDRDDKNASVSIFDSRKIDRHRYIDHADPDNQGSVIDLVMWVKNCDAAEAFNYLHTEYGFEKDEFKPDQPREPKTKVEWVAEQVYAQAEQLLCDNSYLIKQRHIPKKVVEFLIQRRTLGYNNWTSPIEKPGTKGYCGPAVAFITRCYNTSRVVAIDSRFYDAELNGGQKTKAQGVKVGFPFIPDPHQLASAHTVIVVESPINAISVMAALDPNCTGKTGYSTLATRGLHINDIDWLMLRNKFVILAFDNDLPLNKREPKEGKAPSTSNHRPGPECEWKIYELLTGLNIPTLICDKRLWEGVNDVNDLLGKRGLHDTARLLRRTEYHLIPGLPGNNDEPLNYATLGHRRLYLPDHDFSVYWQFRVKKDFTFYVKLNTDEETGEEKITSTDLCGFRIASLSRIKIASANAALTGEYDSAPNVVFAATVQLPRHPDNLIRTVLTDDQIHNIDIWSKFGTIWRRSQFTRMLSILERSTILGARDAINFVGLAWKGGKTVVVEGQDTYFTNPEQQCPYHNLTFPSGLQSNAKVVVDAYAATFKESAALMLLLWGVGAHLKTFLGRWPHCIVQAQKNSGKSTLIKRLERTIAFKMLSGQSLETSFRILTSISHTYHPIGWEEISARSKRVIDSAVSTLQECYNYTVTYRGSDMTEFVQAAPVLLAGEDVPVDSLLGKLIMIDLTGKKGELLREDLPQFPVKQWLTFLTALNRVQAANNYQKCLDYMAKNSCSQNKNDSSSRIIENYACILLAWQYMCEFADLPSNYNDFVKSLIVNMNKHINDTTNSREPWIWILEVLFTEIDAGQFRLPYTFEMYEDKYCLVIRTSSIMHHISTSINLKGFYDSLPIKSDRGLKSLLKNAGVIIRDGVERKINNSRYSGMCVLDVKKLKTFGLNPTIPDHEQSTN